MRFYGNQICCGSYACLNAVQDPAIDPSMFEISTSVPFGIRHCANAAFDRLLTTLHDPNQSLDNTLSLWGYHVSTIHATSFEELLPSLCLPGQGTAILGPVNMGGLQYQAAPSLLHRLDHYIALAYHNESEILCTDSEGLLNYRVSLAQLMDWINIDSLPEACGQFTLRIIRREKEWDWFNILSESMRGASNNLREAEKIGQGSNAIWLCLNYVEQNERFRWRLPLLYDIQYLHQRKRLMQLLLTSLQSAGLFHEWKIDLLQQILVSQEALLSEIYRSLRWENCLSRDAFMRLIEAEKNLAKNV